nr:MAG TPA: hypothetical protein [Caudoviricetes sp.]
MFCISLSLSVSILRPALVVLSWTTLQRYNLFGNIPNALGYILV